MFDLIFLFICPLVITIIASFIIAVVLNENSKKTTKKTRIRNIASQPRNVHDTNHKRSKIEKLMIPEGDKTFRDDYSFFIKNSISNINTD